MRRIEAAEELFPEDFDAEIYRHRNPDLRKMSMADLLLHYRQFGQQEGRICSRISDRTSLINCLPNDLPILEIGPFTNPWVAADSTDYFDILTTEDLRTRALEHGLDPSGVPEIRWVDPAGSLESVTETYDVVVSSHVVEHQVDLVRHLREVETLLKPGGAYVLAIPDKRYCFDQTIAESSIAEVLDAHHSGRTQHDLRSVIEHLALTTHNDPQRHWKGDSPPLAISVTDIQRAIDHYQQTSSSVDVHSWQFTPNSFNSIVELLRELNYINLSCRRVYPTVFGSLEFFVVMTRERR